MNSKLERGHYAFTPDIIDKQIMDVIFDLFPSCKAVKAEVPRDIKYDPVTKPEHYNHNRLGIECIKAIEASMSAEEFLGYLRGNALKYIWRFKYKNGIEDLNKAMWYINLLKEKYGEFKA